MRIQVNLSNEMSERIEMYANKMGVSRSALCSVAIGQYVMSMDKAYSIVEDIGESAKVKLLEDEDQREAEEAQEA